MRYIVAVDVALKGGKSGLKVLDVTVRKTVQPRHLAMQILLDTPGSYRATVHECEHGWVVAEA